MGSIESASFTEEANDCDATRETREGAKESCVMPTEKFTQKEVEPAASLRPE